MTDAPPERGSGPARTGEIQGNRFPKGASGNPRGRPSSGRNRASVLLDRRAEGEAEAILHNVVEAAKGGDLRAAEILLVRIWPPRRGRPVWLELPPAQTADGVSEAMAAVVDAMARGKITPDEAATITAVLEARCKAIETRELAERVCRLEQQTERR